MQLSGISIKTTAFAPILTLFPIVISPRIHAPAPIITLSPILGASPPSPNLPLVPIETFCLITLLLPIFALGCMTTPRP